MLAVSWCWLYSSFHWLYSQWGTTQKLTVLLAANSYNAPPTSIKDNENVSDMIIYLFIYFQNNNLHMF